MNLPRLIVPARLASVASLEVVVYSRDIQDDDGRFTWDLDHLDPILGHVATHCRNLRSICISLCGYRIIPGIPHGPLLPLVDSFRRSMDLRDMVLEVPSEDYLWLRGTCSRFADHPLEPPTTDLMEWSNWRSLDRESPENQFRRLENYPSPPLRLPLPEDGAINKLSFGYWLSQGGEPPLTGHVFSCGI
jgi:hypothetical protein